MSSEIDALVFLASWINQHQLGVSCDFMALVVQTSILSHNAQFLHSQIHSYVSYQVETAFTKASETPGESIVYL